MAKKTVNIALDQSSEPATIRLFLTVVQDNGAVNDFDLSDNVVIEIFSNETSAGPLFEFFPKSIFGLQWKVEFLARPGNPDMNVQSPFDERTYLSDESDSLSEGIDPEAPPDPAEEATISAEINDQWAAQVQPDEVWEFDYTVSFVGNTAAPITRRLRAKRR